MDEFLWELREHSAGLNCGRWDYIFSFIKKRAEDPSAVLPDRSQVTMDKGFLAAYVKLLIKTCHRRGDSRDGRDGGADPDQGRPCRQRGGAREGARGQAARGEGRPRRDMGGAPRPRPDRQGDLRRAHARAEPARRLARRRERHPAGPAARPRRARAPTPAFDTTFASGFSTSRPGCVETAAFRSTT